MQSKEYEEFVLGMASKIYQYDRFAPEVIHGAMGVVTEGAELLDIVRKGIFYGKNAKDYSVLDECGDVLWFLTLTLRHSGFTLADAIKYNMNKLTERHGGREFNQERAIAVQTREKPSKTYWHPPIGMAEGQATFTLGPVPAGAYEKMVKQES